MSNRRWLNRHATIVGRDGRDRDPRTMASIAMARQPGEAAR